MDKVIVVIDRAVTTLVIGMVLELMEINKPFVEKAVSNWLVIICSVF